MLQQFSESIEIVEYLGSSDTIEYVVGWVRDSSKANYISVFPRYRGYTRDEKMIPREIIISRRLLVEGTR